MNKQKTPINNMNFGKYKGKTFEEVYAIDPDYIRWLRDTTDPTDAKNKGQYAKQNQERIAYLDKLLNGVSAPNLAKNDAPVMAQIPVAAKTFETMLKILMSLEEKIDVLLNRTKEHPDNKTVNWDDSDDDDTNIS